MPLKILNNLLIFTILPCFVYTQFTYPVKWTRTLVGSGEYTTRNDVGTAASLRDAVGITEGTDGTIYFVDGGGHCVRKIDINLEVFYYSGPCNAVTGSTNSIGTYSLFQSPWGIVTDSGNNLYVADSGNHRIRKINTLTEVSNYAGSGSATFVDGKKIDDNSYFLSLT
jgi:hypothetical protein